MYLIKFHKHAQKDAKRLKAAGLDLKAKSLIALIEQDPFGFPPAYEALVGNLAGMYSRRITREHRLVYTVDNTPITVSNVFYNGTITVLRMWTHYE